MSKISVAFLDSGIGGLPYLEWVKVHYPDLAVIYYADTAHFPYGELSPSALKNAVLRASRVIFDHCNPAILAIVCNTASVLALEDVRAIAPCPVVGTVPALKPAAQTGRGSIGLLATQGTVDSPYVNRLIEAFAPSRKIIRVAAGNIVRYVEEDWLDDSGKGVATVLERALTTLKGESVESLVIGCTHFLHVIEPIREQMGNVNLIDSREGVGRRVLSLLKKEDCFHGDSWFYLSRKKGCEKRYRRFSEIFNLQWGGLLK